MAVRFAQGDFNVSDFQEVMLRLDHEADYMLSKCKKTKRDRKKWSSDELGLQKQVEKQNSQIGYGR